MGRKTKLSEEQFFAMLDRVLAEADEPLAVMDFDAEEFNASINVDDLPPPPATVKPVGTAASSSPLNGTRPICIRIPVRVIHAFKAQASKTGGCYQVLMNRAMAAAAAGFV